MEEESFLQLVTSQTTALNQVAMISSGTKEVLEKVVENQEKQTELIRAEIVAANEFRDNTFKLLVYLLVFLMVVVGGLLVKLNVKGADVLQDTARMALPVDIPHDSKK